MLVNTPSKTGEKLQSRQLLQFVRETNPGEYDPDGARAVLTCLKGEIQPDEAWDTFRPDGVTEAAWAALSKSHNIYSGTIAWDYAQYLLLAQMLFGDAAGAHAVTDPAPDPVNGVAVVEETWALSPLGGRSLATFTLEYGQPNSCSRCPYGVVLSIGRNSDRDGTRVEGSITILCRKAVASNVAMTGAAGNAMATIVGTNVTGPVVLSVQVQEQAAKTVTLAIGDSEATVEGKFAAEGLTVAATGGIAASGTTYTVSDSPDASYHGTYTPVPGEADSYTLNSNRFLFLSGGQWYFTPVLHDTTNRRFLKNEVSPTSGNWVDGITSETVNLTIVNGTVPAGGTLAIAVTSPANTRVLITKTSGDGYAVTQTQNGGNGQFVIPTRKPVMANHFGVRIGATRAALAAAPLEGGVKIAGWSADNLLELVWFAEEGELSFQSHADNDERALPFTLRCAETSSLCQTLLGYAHEIPSRRFWIEIRDQNPGQVERLAWQGYVSVSGVTPFQAAGKVRAREFALTPMLDDLPFGTNLVADGGASFYLVARHAA